MRLGTVSNNVPMEDGEDLPLTNSASVLTSQLLECQDLQRRKISDLDAERKKREQIVDSGVQLLTDRLKIQPIKALRV